MLRESRGHHGAAARHELTTRRRSGPESGMLRPTDSLAQLERILQPTVARNSTENSRQLILPDRTRATTPASTENKRQLIPDPARAWAIRKFSGRDLGVAAIRTINPRESLLVEKPLIRLTPNIGGPLVQWYDEPERVRASLGTLSRAAPQKTLGTFFDKDLDPVLSTNCFTLESSSGEYHSYCFRQISRFNHSCDPDAVVVWDPATEAATVRTVRAIPNGQEITINYGAIGGRRERSRHLKACFGFDCRCAKCAAEAAAEQKEIDRRLLEAKELFAPRNAAQELLGRRSRMAGAGQASVPRLVRA